MQSTKRMKIGHEGSSATEVLEHSKTINDLPTDLMKNIFSFVGKGNYCFVGPVSKDFCYNYLTFDLFEEKFAHKLDFLHAIGRNKITTPVAASTSFELAEHCFFYAPDDFNMKVLTKAALNGRQDIAILGHAMGVRYPYCLDKALLELTKRGDLEMLQLLHHKYDFPSCHVFRKAAFYGHFDILNWTKTLDSGSGMGFTRDMECLFESAAQGGRQEVIEWLKVTVEDITGHPFDRRNNPYLDFNGFLISAARGGHLDLLTWLSEGDDDALRNVNILNSAVYSGNIELIKYLVDRGCPYDSSRLCINAVYIGDHVKSLEILTFLHRLGVPWHERTCSEAAFRSNLNLLIYARENGCLWDEDTLETAVKKGNLPIVEYCLQNNCPISTENCSLAVVDREDHDHALKLLKLLRKYSAPWNEKTCSDAALMGNLKALQWARSFGCPWDTETFDNAVHEGDIAMIEYCLKNNCPTEDVDINVFHYGNELSILKILQNNGYIFTEKNCAEALEEKDIRALRWLRYNGCPWDDNLCGKAVQLNNCGALEFLYENGCPLTKETYAFCFDEDGLAGKYSEIPTEHECSDEILWYLQSKDCPQPDPDDWIITQDNGSENTS